jgi:hypothetical protein
MNKRIVFVHGRGVKPRVEVETKLVHAALAHGLARVTLDRAITREQVTVAYFADVFNAGVEPDDEYDAALSLLFGRPTASCTRDAYLKERAAWTFRAWRDELSAVASPWVSRIGLGDALIAQMAPELAQYLVDEGVRERVLSVVQRACAGASDVLLIGHSMGAVVALDALHSEYAVNAQHFLSIGAPLGDAAIYKAMAQRKWAQFPKRCQQWVNVAAEDDHIAHHNALSASFPCLFGGAVKDLAIENFFVHPLHGANAHKSYGYLDHPKVGQVIAQWLGSKPV